MITSLIPYQIIFSKLGCLLPMCVFALLEYGHIWKTNSFIDFYLQLFSILHGIDSQIAFYCVSHPSSSSVQSLIAGL